MITTLAITLRNEVVSQKQRVVFLPEADDTGLDPLEWDASVSETHDFSVQPTQIPVEQGANITDHVVKLPKKLSLALIQSNTPIIAPNTTDESPPDRVASALAWIEFAESNAIPLTVQTTVRSYGSMLIEKIRVTRDAPNGNVLAASIDLSELIIASSQTIDRKLLTRAATQAEQGVKAVTPATAAEAEETTVLYDVFDSGLKAVTGSDLGLKEFR